MDVSKLREQIPACENTIYMNTGWSGPSPAPVVEAIKERLEYESYQGPTAPEVLESGKELQLKAREAMAGLVNAKTSEIYLTQNTTEGLNIIINGFPWQEGDEIITFSLEHPSVLFACFNAQKRHRPKVRVITLSVEDDWDVIVGNVERAINARTRMLAFSHIQFSYGFRMPLERLQEVSKNKGIFMLVDGAQTPGHIELDMKALGVHFYAMPGHKWLLGPDGIGALFIREELIEAIRPTYAAHNAGEWVNGRVDFDIKAKDILKFRLTTSSTPLAAGLLEAIEFIKRVGVLEIEGRNKGLAGYLKGKLSALPEANILSPLEGPATVGLTSFQLQGVDPVKAFNYLWEEHRIVARSVNNPPSLRISTDFFNTEEEIDCLVAALSGFKS